MDIKKGHPGAIFHWFFDSDQGSDALAQLLFIIYGSNRQTPALIKDCLNRKEEFNDILGPEILFLFFDPDVPVHKLAEDGRRFRGSLKNESTSRYLYSGMGEARAVPPGMIEFGRERFRSESPGSYYSPQFSANTAQATRRIVAFFSGGGLLRACLSSLRA